MPVMARNRRTGGNYSGARWAFSDRPRRRGTARPWKVFVREIGPTFTYASEVRARFQAERLVSGEEWVEGRHGLIGSYAEVVVTGPLPDDGVDGWRRWTYRSGGRPVLVEEFVRGRGWIRAEELTEESRQAT